VVRQGLRILAPDRPGLGGSGPQSGLAVSERPADVVSDLPLRAPSGFEPASPRVSRMLCHGKDAAVPVAMGRLPAREIPGGQARIMPGEGHFSLPVRHMWAILRGLGGVPA
jgi:hypothetical protein